MPATGSGDRRWRLVGDRRRHLALDAVLFLSCSPALEGLPRTCSRRARRRRDALAAAAPRHPALDDAGLAVALLFRLILAFKVFDEVYLLPAAGRARERDVSFTSTACSSSRISLGYGAHAVGRHIVVVLAAAHPWRWAARRGESGHEAAQRASSAPRSPRAAALVAAALCVLARSCGSRGGLQDADRDPERRLVFTPTLNNYDDVLFSKTSEYVHSFATSVIVATGEHGACSSLARGRLFAVRLRRARWLVAGPARLDARLPRDPADHHGRTMVCDVPRGRARQHADGAGPRPCHAQPADGAVADVSFIRDDPARARGGRAHRRRHPPRPSGA